MYPIFFSVSEEDKKFAEKVWARLPDDWVYLYSKTGEEGAHMWEEISRRELPKSKIFVVFWSRAYTTAGGCMKEILQAKYLVRYGMIRPVILRLDDFPITWNDKLERDAKPALDALKVMLDFRTSSANVTVPQAIDLVQRVAEPLLKSDHPRLPRHDLLQTLRGAIQKEKDRFRVFPAIWVSGFNGVGRETLVREFNRTFAPNGRGISIEVNEASLPRQTLLRIESEAFGSDAERLHQLNHATTENEAAAVADAVERVFAAGNYTIFRHSRIVEENVELPEWLDDVVNALSSATRPKLLIISQLPLSAERRTRCRDSLVAQRVNTVDEHQMVQFCYQLIGHFDKHPTRWAEYDVARVVHASGGTIGFLVSLVRAAAWIEDFDQIDRLIAADSETMAASITLYVRWAFSQLRDLDDEQRTLLFLNDISPCDISDLEKVIVPKKPMLRVLGKLLELGLVERGDDGLYKLTPLLARRLSRDLIRPDLLLWLRSALLQLLKKPAEIEADGHEYIRIESRIQAAMLADSEDLPNSVVHFVSAAHWFQAGIRLYHARRREPAYRILKKAFERRAEFSGTSRTELIRYFCLSATRNRKYQEAQQCITLLDGVFHTKGMATFLRGDLLEYQGQYVDAVKEYERALDLNKGKERRLERTYRAIVHCILRTPRPHFVSAERYAQDWLRLRKTVFSLMALARVYLHWKYRGVRADREVPENIDELYSSALAELEADPGVGSAHFELRAEEAEFEGDFKGALDYMNKAIEADPRFELRIERWRLMAKSGGRALGEQAVRELEAARINPEYKSNWLPFLPLLAETFALALKAANRPLGSLNTFAPELSDGEIGEIIARIQRRR